MCSRIERCLRQIALVAALVLATLGPLAASAATQDPNLLKVLSDAEELMRGGKFEQALAQMDRGVAFHTQASRSNLARLHLQRGIVLVLLDRPAQARTAFNLAQCYDPSIDPSTLDLSPTTARIFDEARLGGCPGLPSDTGQAAATPPVPKAKSGSGSSGGSKLPAVLMISGAVLVAGGGVLGVLALNAEDEAASAYQVDAKAARDRADLLALGADIGIFGGLGLAGTGLVLYLLADDEEPAGAGGDVRLLPLGPGDGPGMAFSLRF